MDEFWYDEARVAAAIVAAKFAVFITNNDPSITLTSEEIMPTTGGIDFRREMIDKYGEVEKWLDM